MPVMLERWNDERMDALAAKVDGIETQLLEHRKEMREDRGEIREELHELRRDTKAGFEQIQRAMIHVVVGVSGSMVLGFATVIAAVLLGA